jgi:Uma2 family endonuclease
MTGTQFDALPYEEGRQWELVDGELIAVPGPTGRHQDVVFLLQSAIRSFLKDFPISALVYADVEFAMTQDDRVRPDVFVLLGANALAFDKDKVPAPGAPDIAIEVISSSDGSLADLPQIPPRRIARPGIHPQRRRLRLPLIPTPLTPKTPPSR